MSNQERPENTQIDPGQSVLVQSAGCPDQLSIYNVMGVKNGMVRLGLFDSLTAKEPRSAINIGLKNLIKHGSNSHGSLRFEILSEDDIQPDSGQQTIVVGLIAPLPLVITLSKQQVMTAIGI